MATTLRAGALSLILLSTILFSALVVAVQAAYEAPSPQWNNTYERAVNYSVNGSAAYKYGDTGKSVIQTSDGGYAIAADIEDHYYMYYNEYYGTVVENRSVLLIRTGPNGEVNWTKIVPNLNTSRSIIQTRDLGYAICGTDSNSYPSTACLVKLDPQGNLKWSKNFGSQAVAIQSSEGEYLVAGALQLESDIAANVVKIDQNGNVVWNKTLPSTQTGGYSIAYSAIQLKNGDFAVAGLKDNAWLVILDNQGNTKLEKTFTGYHYAITQTNDSALILSGSLTQNNYGSPVSLGLIRKIDLQGNEVWTKTFSDPANHASQWFTFKAIIEVADGGYVAAGDHALFKVYINGTLHWYQSSTFDVTNQLGTNNALTATSDEGFVSTGNLWDSTWFAKFPLSPDQVIPEMSGQAFILFAVFITGFIISLPALARYRPPQKNCNREA